MKFKANFREKPVNFQMDDCQIEKVVELPHDDFYRLKITPLADQPFLAENKDCMFHMDGVIHCLLALGQGSNDGVLIDAERYNYPRVAAYVPGMRDIVNAEMDRAADYIVRQATENTTSGSWWCLLRGAGGTSGADDSCRQRIGFYAQACAEAPPRGGCSRHARWLHRNRVPPGILPTDQ